MKKGEPAHNFKDLTGKTFGRLFVIKRVGNIGKGSGWLCKCSCGNAKIASQTHLLHSKCPSCGCYQHEVLSRKRGKGTSGAITHGLSDTRLYEIWCGMIKRCKNPRSYVYKNYGGRGITVCDEWSNDFMVFYNWAINSGYSDGLTIERKNVDGNYEPDNCCWIPRSEQSFNQRKTIHITINGETKPLPLWSKECGISTATMYYRFKNGWTGEDLLKPVDKRFGNHKKQNL